ncbi:MAG: ABC transporter permease subunit [Parachlamydiaceae bacterium]
MREKHVDAYWHSLYRQFRKNLLGRLGFYFVLLFCFVGIYAPFFASSKPFAVKYDGNWYFPFFRYLFFSGFYTKKLDVFFNLLMFSLPIGIAGYLVIKNKRIFKSFLMVVAITHLLLFFFFSFFYLSDPASDPVLSQQRQEAIQRRIMAKKQLSLIPDQLQEDWHFNLRFMNQYAKLNTVLRYVQRKDHHKVLERYGQRYIQKHGVLPSLWQMDQDRSLMQIQQLEKKRDRILSKVDQAFQRIGLYLEACQSLQAFDKKMNCRDLSQIPKEERKELLKAQKILQDFNDTNERLDYYRQRKEWLENSATKIEYLLLPIIPFHWEDDAGGDQRLNQYLPWWELTRGNRKDLAAALIFGIRISLVVGFLAVALATLIGVPIGALAGFYGGSFDIVISRLLEIWESMPTFFMLLLVIAITQSKSIFIVIGVIGLFAWPIFSRYTRGEFFKQRNLPYVEASRTLGFSSLSIIFKDILPNAIPPLLTLLPFAIMGAITSEAGLSFLGLGEEGSCSWGVLMDEGRRGFPSEAYLLWPPAIVLTVLLVSIALVGDALRDALDPKLKK